LGITWRCASGRDLKQVQRWRSSIPRPQKTLNKRAFSRSFGLRRGQEGQGRKRHILVDTLGFFLSVIVHPADIQDRDGIFHSLRRARRLFPFIGRIFADGGYRADKTGLAWSHALELGNWRSSSDPLLLATRSYRSDGLSKGPSPGLAANAVWLTISNFMPAPSLHSSASP
jgi:hypothetical protein